MGKQGRCPVVANPGTLGNTTLFLLQYQPLSHTSHAIIGNTWHQTAFSVDNSRQNRYNSQQ